MSPARVSPAVRLALLLLLGVVLSGSSCSWAFKSDTSSDDDDDDDGGTIIIVEDATFGGWGLAPALDDRPGVLSTARGWNGGALPFCGEEWADWTGHRRVTRVRFDPAQTSYGDLLAAVRGLRAAQLRATVYAASQAQKQAAFAAFPPGSLPALRLRDAGSFTPD